MSSAKGSRVCRYNQRVYRPTGSTPAQARQFVVAHLAGDLAGTPALDDAVLAVTELVTNAINAGSQQIIVDVDLHRDHLVLAVADDAPGLPEVQKPEQSSTHGRGLHIIDALSRRWGTERQSVGKRVWAELPVDPSNSWLCRLA